MVFTFFLIEMDVNHTFRKNNSAEFYSLENLHYLCKGKLLNFACSWHSFLYSSILSCIVFYLYKKTTTDI